MVAEKGIKPFGFASFSFP